MDKKSILWLFDELTSKTTLFCYLNNNKIVICPSNYSKFDEYDFLWNIYLLSPFITEVESIVESEKLQIQMTHKINISYNIFFILAISICVLMISRNSSIWVILVAFIILILKYMLYDLPQEKSLYAIQVENIISEILQQ